MAPVGGASRAANARCQAINFHDGQPCSDPAVGTKHMFCPTHSRQCYAMYRGYKRRNAKLDTMSQPAYLSQSTVPLADNTFGDLSKVSTIREVLQHLHTQFALLDRVITARETHGKHFYPEDLDYGHKTWIDKLLHERDTVEKALVRLARRYQEVLFQDERWYKWVTERQREQDDVEDKLKRKIKLEAAVFRRHAKKVAERRARRSEREKEALQARDLDEVFQERMRLDEMTDDELDEWDPIEDLVEDGRSRYIDLIMHFLWLDGQAEAEELKPPGDDFAEAARALVERSKNGGKKMIQGKKTKGKGKGKAKPKQSKDEAQTPKGHKSHPTSALVLSTNGPEPDKTNIETRKDMHERLRLGVEKTHSYGPQVVGTFQNPSQLANKTAPIPEEDIKILMAEIAEIKLLLFCRLLLSHATLLPIAAQAQSVADFLTHPDLQESDLRELCVRLENPSLQDVRDACADLSRDKTSADDATWSDSHGGDMVASTQEPDTTSDTKDIPQSSVGGLVDFGRINEGRPPGERMKVQVCGKPIWNYASEKAMSRDGWLQFSIMAKDCSVDEAIHLCRNWAELSDLSDLAQYNYFPAAKWAAWGGHHFHKQFIEKGFMIYRDGFDWGNDPGMNTLGDPSARAWRRDRNVKQRSYMCAKMNRNDPTTRRFIQYCVMHTGDFLTCVRDAKTGRVITIPPEHERWLVRQKTGGVWRTVTEVGAAFLEECHAKARWQTSFDDYYDVVIWDLLPNRESTGMYNLIGQTHFKALRVKAASDVYHHQEPLLRSLTRDRATMRVRRIRPGEMVRSLWEQMHNGAHRAHHFVSSYTGMGHQGGMDDMDPITSPRAFYNESDVLEDSVLFTDDASDTRNVKLLTQMADPKGDLAIEIFGPMMEIMLGLQLKDSPRLTRSGGMYQEKTMSFFDAVIKTPKMLKDACDQLSTTVVAPGLITVLKRTGLLTSTPDMRLKTSSMGMDQLDDYQANTMARLAGFASREKMKLADMSPGSSERWSEFRDLVSGIEDSAFMAAGSTHSLAWAKLCMEILDQLSLQVNAVDGDFDQKKPWPHPYIGNDLLRAQVMMSLYFPDLEEAAPTQWFLNSAEGRRFTTSLLLHEQQAARAQACVPDRRTSTSHRRRPESFFNEFDELMNGRGNDYFADAYPMEKRKVLRPIIAQLYKASMIQPAYAENEPRMTPGFATCNTEPHRPDTPDLFLSYLGWGPTQPSPSHLDPSKWPDLLSTARTFAKSTTTTSNSTGSESASAKPRFALLRLWSAPHFWPTMVAGASVQGSRFLDTEGRIWEWNFCPKDLPHSEEAIHQVGVTTLTALRAKMPELRCVHAGDLFLVMGTDARELLKGCVAVTMAVQSRPWMREVDLWTSFVNVDLGFLEGLDKAWWRF